eukprot:TRINITY_DN67741_c11_g1_i1.p1 TRINITY_DN67741_c11_g1~~TRINITY_DN67741_c11_g1_i1.p1  ORF type:complete len:303 (+),score=20.94 TRINITY_DN67741_c11_g1_i1:76-909(+)
MKGLSHPLTVMKSSSSLPPTNGEEENGEERTISSSVNSNSPLIQNDSLPTPPTTTATETRNGSTVLPVSSGGGGSSMMVGGTGNRNLVVSPTTTTTTTSSPLTSVSNTSATIVSMSAIPDSVAMLEYEDLEDDFDNTSMNISLLETQGGVSLGETFSSSGIACIAPYVLFAEIVALTVCIATLGNDCSDDVLHCQKHIPGKTHSNIPTASHHIYTLYDNSVIRVGMAILFVVFSTATLVLSTVSYIPKVKIYTEYEEMRSPTTTSATRFPSYGMDEL